MDYGPGRWFRPEVLTFFRLGFIHSIHHCLTMVDHLTMDDTIVVVFVVYLVFNNDLVKKFILTMA